MSSQSSPLRYTLIADGSSDAALIPMINWLIREHVSNLLYQDVWADLSSIHPPPRTLRARLQTAVQLYPCDLLLIHRDAEAQGLDIRLDEIREAASAAGVQMPHVSVVPVRMTEAWLLFDEPAIRRAAGNPNGREALQIPRLRDVEDLPDPKSVLRELLRTANGLHGRRLRAFQPSARRVSELIDDFAPLRALPAFRRLDRELDAFLDVGGWSAPSSSPDPDSQSLP